MKNILTFIIVIAAVTSLYSGNSYIITNGIVNDTATGLYWTRCSLRANGAIDSSKNCEETLGQFTWEEAIDACNNLNYESHKDWRLPNIRELQSIVTYYNIEGLIDRAINVTAFPNTGRHYWTSTTNKSQSTTAWAIDFSYGNVTFDFKETSTTPAYKYVRCVTGP